VPDIAWSPVDMSRFSISGSSKGGLRRLLGLFFVALAIPSAVLTWQAYSRLKWESFHQYQLLAEELLGRVDHRMRDLVAREEARAFTDYRFLALEGAPSANDLQRSALSAFPVNSDIPGLLGHFQVDTEGRFTTPLVPDDPNISVRAYGITDVELGQRHAVRERLLQILSQQGLLASGPRAEAGDTKDAERRAAKAEAERSKPRAQAAPVVASRQRVEAVDDVAGWSPPASDSADPPTARSGMSTQQASAKVRDQKLAQEAFDRLSEEAPRPGAPMKQQASAGNIGRVDELKLDQAFDTDSTQVQVRRPLPRFRERVEYAAVPREQILSAEPAAPAPGDAALGAEADATSPALVRIFESEVDPFEFGLVGNDYFVLYRKVWREGKRYIQGAVVERAALLRELIETPYRHTALAGMSRLGIVFGEEILSALGGQQGDSYLSRTEELSGTLLYRGRLSSPLDRLELIFTATQVPPGKAGSLVIWVALILGMVISGGLFLMYRLGVKQIELNRQQRDFVSAVSHELKTPLTSIRMYSEMLREGWADETRRRSYYDFIHEESERLSRLISNVLHLARMSRDELRVELRPVGVTQLMDMVGSKVASLIDHAGFELVVECSDAAAAKTVAIDDDAFTQIMINLVDNAIKFSARAEERLITIQANLSGVGHVDFVVRDRGPGIPRDQMKKIFKLFYRSESELTRETAGTGIGLALVHRLASTMGGEVDVVNRNPGAEFRVRFPVLTGPSQQSADSGKA